MLPFNIQYVTGDMKVFQENHGLKIDTQIVIIKRVELYLSILENIVVSILALLRLGTQQWCLRCEVTQWETNITDVLWFQRDGKTLISYLIFVSLASWTWSDLLLVYKLEEISISLKLTTVLPSKVYAIFLRFWYLYPK